MAGKQVARWAGWVCTMVGAGAVMIACLPQSALGETIGDHLWNLRENNQSFFGANVPYVRPWCGSTDDGYGMFVGPPPYGGDFPWGASSTAGNPLDGSFSIDRGVDHQFGAWTFLYVSTPTTISLTGQGDCVPRWFLNYQFDSPQQFPLSSPASINLNAGWNRLDITGYNQMTDFLFESGALTSQVTIMDSAGVPEPSTIVSLASLLIVGALLWLIRKRALLRTILALLTILPCLTSVASAETMGDHLWNLRQNTQDFFHDNVPYIRPWRGSADDGWGMFVGPAPYGGDFLWHLTSTTGNPLDGSLFLNLGVDHQFDAWTYLYVSTPTTISLTGQGDCVPRWFLNYAFDSPQQFPLGTPASISLAAGWNRLDITGYNQNRGFLFESGALTSQVSIMNTSPVPEPSAICSLVLLLTSGGLVHWIRRGAERRSRGKSMD